MITKRVDVEGNKVGRCLAMINICLDQVWSVHKGNHLSCGQAVLQIGNRIIVGGGLGRVGFFESLVFALLIFRKLMKWKFSEWWW